MAAQSIAVAGAGIAGLTTALYLGRKGYDVHIFDAATELSEVGAGLQLSANPLKCLQALGLLPALKSHAVCPAAIYIRSGQDGSHLGTVPLGQVAEQRYGASYLVIHRADLQRVLLDAVHHCQNVTVHLDNPIESAQITASGVRLIGPKLAGTPIPLPKEYGLLLGADGVRSQIRQNFMGYPGAQHTGYVAYRTTIEPSFDMQHLLNNSGLWLGPDAHMVHYPIKNGRQLNIIAVTKEDWTNDTWSHPCVSQDVRKHFRSWTPDALRLLHSPKSWTRWSLCGVDDRLPWTKDRVALIGDAAHAMLPFSAQGAAMAIEDAAILIKAMDKLGPTPQALEAYEASRKPRIQKMKKLVNRNGRIYHMGMPGRLVRDLVMRTRKPEQLLSTLDWVYTWTADQELLAS